MRKSPAVLLLLIPFFLCMVSAAAKADIIIIANPSVPETVLSKEQIQQIFLGKIVKWPDDTNIHFAILTGNTHKEFLRTFVKRSAIQYRNYWRQQLFTGKGIIPRSFTSEHDLIQFVSETPGAIGYINDRPKLENVNVISVN